MKIKYQFCDGKNVEIEVSEDFAIKFAEMDYYDGLVERKETRRHQSLEKSLEHGWDIADKRVNIEREAASNELFEKSNKAMTRLTEKQRTVVVLHAIHNMSFCKIGGELGLHKNTVYEHYLSAIKKMKKLLKNTRSK